MERKKLLLVSTSFPKQPGDGLSPFMYDLCRHLSRLGWDITALVPHHKGLPDEEAWDGVRVKRFRYLPEHFEDVGYSGGIMPNIKSRPWSAAKLPFYIYAMYREALKMAVEENYDLVNFHWFFPPAFWMGSFARRSGVPVVMTGHGTDILLATKGIFSSFARRAFRRAAAVTVNSAYMKGVLESAVKPPRIVITYIGADEDKFTPAANKPSDSRTILYVGRLIRQKGVDLLIEAFVGLKKSFPDARLRIIGYGPEKEKIVAILKASGLEGSVTFSDMVPHDDLAEVYRRSRVLVLPALIPEGLGLTPAEAGLCGVPTVTFGRGGTSEIVENDKTGLIVEPTREALEAALAKIMGDDVLADRLGANAREHLVDLIGWKKVAGRFDSLFREIVAKRKVSKPITGRGAAWAAAILLVVTVSYVIKMFFDRFERLMGLFR